jgi:hypothetical protein
MIRAIKCPYIETSIQKTQFATQGYSNVTMLTLFGLVAVTAMLVTYALESRSAWYILGFAVACSLGSVYGFLQGAWPFGVVEAIWSVVAVRRWWSTRYQSHGGKN